MQVAAALNRLRVDVIVFLDGHNRLRNL